MTATIVVVNKVHIVIEDDANVVEHIADADDADDAVKEAQILSAHENVDEN